MAEKSAKVRKIGKRGVSPKQALTLAGFDRFLETQGGAYPASIAGIVLRMSPQGVYQASERGWITFFQVGRNRWYGKKDCLFYRFSVSEKFRDCRPCPADHPKKFPL